MRRSLSGFAESHHTYLLYPRELELDPNGLIKLKLIVH